ncbi:hypothetical protein Pcinc_006847 [Petrolisthes cinctipes]|uniref:Reverse transcriptase n=1 Tax=Petrolisthes cinctipes TaxID=88211 RepID=A0AAE1KXY1_PETCI|nr:hypothetical protein Pcinc_006847 [Petrolisthes cinctipes]
MNNEALKAVQEKHRCYKKHKRLETEESKVQYNIAKRHAAYITRKATQEFESRIAKNVKSNPKEFYSYCRNKTMLRGDIATIVKRDGTRAEDPQDIAETMNEFFASVITRENVNIVPEPTEHAIQSEMVDIRITKNMVPVKLREQKPGKSAGPDGVHSKVVVELAEELVEPLAIIFNQSIRSGIVPSAWKDAEVVPIYKKEWRVNHLRSSLLCRPRPTIERDAIRVMDYAGFRRPTVFFERALLLPSVLLSRGLWMNLCLFLSL